MKIIVNGEPQDTRATTLHDLCSALGLGDIKIATAVNGDFVPAPARASHRLAQNDKVEIVAPRQGG